MNSFTPTSGDQDLPASDQSASTGAGLPDLLLVSGEDAERFLHAQLTVDVVSSEVGKALPFAWCNPSGRVLSSGWLLRQENSFALLLAKNSAAATAEALGRFVLRDRVALDPDATHLLPGTQPGADYTLPGTPERPFRLAAGPATTSGEDDSAWLLAGLRCGYCELPMALAGRFLPQMLNLDLIGGISFKKGCYPGQEVIARLFHLGTVKRRLYRYASDGSPPAAGTPITFDGRKTGEVVIAAATQDGCELLAVVEVKSAMLAGLVLDSDEQGPLKSLPLPHAGGPG